MSAYAYCHDCHEVTSGVMDMSSKGLRLGQESNHFACAITYLDPATMPPPIAYTVALLATRPERVADNHITMLRLGLDLHDYPTGALEATCPPAPSTAPDAVNISPKSHAPALASAASTKSLPVSTPTPVTSVDEQMALDFGEASA